MSTKSTTTPKAPRGSKKSAAASASVPSETSEVIKPVVSEIPSPPPAATDAPPAPKVKQQRKRKTAEEASSSSSAKEVQIEVIPAAPVSEIDPTNSLSAELVNQEVVISPLDSLRKRNAKIRSQLHTLASEFAKLMTEVSKLDVAYAKEYKALMKLNSSKKNKKVKSGNRAPSGFVRPTKISDELAVFLNKDLGTEISRTQVTRLINLYITENKLQDPTNRRRILANPALRALLRLPETEELTYFNLQRYMSCHFSKISNPIVSSADAPSAP